MTIFVVIVKISNEKGRYTAEVATIHRPIDRQTNQHIDLYIVSWLRLKTNMCQIYGSLLSILLISPLVWFGLVSFPDDNELHLF